MVLRGYRIVTRGQAGAGTVRAGEGADLGVTAQLPGCGGCHSFSSNLAMAGIDDRIIDHFTGHQTKEMRRRHQHLFPQEKRDALSWLEY